MNENVLMEKKFYIKVLQRKKERKKMEILKIASAFENNFAII